MVRNIYTDPKKKRPVLSELYPKPVFDMSRFVNYPEYDMRYQNS